LYNTYQFTASKFKPQQFRWEIKTTKMKIGIIGLGDVGSGIAKKLAAAGHEVKVNNRKKPDELALKAKELGASPATLEEVVKNVDVIFLCVPAIAIPMLSKDLFKNARPDVIIVETTNYYPFRDGAIQELEKGKVESVWVSEQLGRPVIKAFNELPAYALEHLGKAKGEDGRIAIAVSGDDEKAKQIVSQLVNDSGFDAVDAGSISESWRHQPGTPAYCTELNAAELKKALANAVREKAYSTREFAINKIIKSNPPPSHEEIVELHRSLFTENPNKS
jgi:predicted dinucleotide-binding enzyme